LLTHVNRGFAVAQGGVQVSCHGVVSEDVQTNRDGAVGPSEPKRPTHNSPIRCPPQTSRPANWPGAGDPFGKVRCQVASALALASSGISPAATRSCMYSELLRTSQSARSGGSNGSNLTHPPTQNVRLPARPPEPNQQRRCHVFGAPLTTGRRQAVSQNAPRQAWSGCHQTADRGRAAPHPSPQTPCAHETCRSQTLRGRRRTRSRARVRSGGRQPQAERPTPRPAVRGRSSLDANNVPSPASASAERRIWHNLRRSLRSVFMAGVGFR
jgi:hypothetical protein